MYYINTKLFLLLLLLLSKIIKLIIKNIPRLSLQSIGTSYNSRYFDRDYPSGRGVQEQQTANITIWTLGRPLQESHPCFEKCRAPIALARTMLRCPLLLFAPRIG